MIGLSAATVRIFHSCSACAIKQNFMPSVLHKTPRGATIVHALQVFMMSLLSLSGNDNPKVES